VQPITVIVLYPAEKVEVCVKVAVNVVVSWTVIPKQAINSLKLTVDMPQSPTVT
jgi:hypothetical protein